MVEAGSKGNTGKSYMEKKLEGIERSDPKAEPLSEVLHKDVDEPDLLQADCDNDGTWKRAKVKKKIAMPTEPEELRDRITLMGTA